MEVLRLWIWANPGLAMLASAAVLALLLCIGFWIAEVSEPPAMLFLAITWPFPFTVFVLMLLHLILGLGGTRSPIT